MYRQSSSRNHRSKGVKVKYAVQICLLLAVCFWLIYQVKHSHDKKKEFDETEVKSSLHIQNSNGNNPNLGRKGIYDKITSKNGDKTHELIEDEETVEEENKPEEEDENKLEEEENKPEEDENKPEEDSPEEKNVDHEHENPDDDENEAREVDFGAGQTEGEKSLLDENGHNGVDSSNNKSKHEAREENYKADDASSAVTHEAQTGAIENVNDRTENSTEKLENKKLEEDNKEVRKDFEVGTGEIPSVDGKSVETISEIQVDVLDDSKNDSPPNDTLIIEKFSRDYTSNGSAEVKIENRNSSKTEPELNHFSQAGGLDPNSTDSTEIKDIDLQHYEDFSNSSSNNTGSLSSDSSLGQRNQTGSSSDLDQIKMEKTGVNDGTYETSESTVTENLEEEIQHDDGIDKSDVSDSQEEKHVLTDLDTLPEIQTEGTNSEADVAEE